jgi:glycerol-3-phosphate dehydrogenase
VLHDALHIVSRKHVRLVKGSHLVTRRLYEGAHAYILQNVDRRVIFAIPYEGEFTLIGSTDTPHEGAPGPVSISDAETDYLLAAVSRYFKREVTQDDIVSSFAGLRPLFDDGAFDASVVTRDYAFDLDREGAPALSIFGGKITTARRLAEHALETLQHAFARMGPAWTGATPLAGGEGLQGEIEPLLARLPREKPFLPQPLARRLAHAYGARVFSMLGDAATLADLGEDFGCGLTRRELEYLIA